jgi:hypothetical protein
MPFATKWGSRELFATRERIHQLLFDGGEYDPSNVWFTRSFRSQLVRPAARFQIKKEQRKSVEARGIVSISRSQYFLFFCYSTVFFSPFKKHEVAV